VLIALSAKHFSSSLGSAFTRFQLGYDCRYKGHALCFRIPLQASEEPHGQGLPEYEHGVCPQPYIGEIFTGAESTPLNLLASTQKFVSCQCRWLNFGAHVCW